METLSPAPTPPIGKGLHTLETRTLCKIIFFFLHPTSQMDFTNATHGPECHIPPEPRTCGHKRPTHLGLSLPPGTVE